VNNKIIFAAKQKREYLVKNKEIYKKPPTLQPQNLSDKAALNSLFQKKCTKIHFFSHFALAIKYFTSAFV